MEPRTTWKYSKMTEVDRIVQIASHIAHRLYSARGFDVLPYPRNSIDNIYFPNLRYKDIANFWKRVKTKKFTTPMPVSQKLVGEITDLLEESKERPITTKEIKRLKADWSKVEKRFWKILCQMLPEKTKIVEEVEIRPTKYGSLVSFSKSGEKLSIYVRVDADTSRVAEGIISALYVLPYKEEIKIEGASDPWTCLEIVVDFLMTESSLSSLFPDYEPTLEGVSKKQKASTKKASMKYLAKLGLGVDPVFEIAEETGQILLRGKGITDNLTRPEERVLCKLVENKNNIVDLDTIAAKLWPKDAEERFSLYAISKTMSRIREKLEKLGVNPCAIQAKRGRGYMLVD